MTDEVTENKNDWCYRAETTTLLSLSVAQIHMSLTEGDNSVNALSESFQELANICLEVEKMAKETDSSSMNTIANVAENMSGQINSAIVAFQFYDRLCQRLEHVALSLDELSSLLTLDDNLNNSTGWKDLREQIRQHYTMKEEHLMFESIMKGASAQEAMELYKQSVQNATETEDDIELF